MTQDVRITPDHLWQAGRALPSLDPDTFEIDGRGMAERTAWATGFARLLTYFGADGTPHPAPTSPGEIGAWERFFRSDVSFLLAEIAGFDAPAGNQSHRGVDPDLLQVSGQVAFRRLALWTDAALTLELQNPGGRVEAALADTLRAASERQLRHLVPAVFRNRQPQVCPAAAAVLVCSHAETADASFRADPVDPALVPGAITRALGHVAETARRFLTVSLTEKRDHPAHTALFLTFLSLLDGQRAGLNRLTARHLDYYYRDVLRLAPHGLRADRVDLWVEPTKGAFAAGPVVIPKGTALIATGGTAARPILFDTDRDLDLTPAKLAAVRAIRVLRGRSDDRGAAPVAAVEAFEGRDGLSALAGSAGWPLFGADGPRPVPGAGADLGFALAAPVLGLAGGSRQILVTLSLVAGAGRGPDDLMAALSAMTATDDAHARSRLLCDGFDVALSGPDGFFPVDAEVALSPPIGGQKPSAKLVFRLSLGAGDPPVVPPSDMAGVPPLLRITLNPDAPHYLYSAFRGLRIAHAKVETEVTGLRRLTLRGDTGPLDPAKPFAPFGLAPLPGAGFTFSSPELWNRRLSRLRLRMTWTGLPPPPQSFGDYYAGYDLGLANDSFRVALSAGGADGWRPVPAIGPAAQGGEGVLFHGSAKGRGVSPETVIDFDPGALGPVRNGGRADPGGIAGVFRLALAAPEAGFGARVHTNIVASRAMENARRMFWGGKVAPLPPPPLVPKVTGIALDYAGVAETDAPLAGDALRLWRVDPTGPIRPARTARVIAPDYDADGLLFLGFSGLVPGGRLTLLVEMEDSPWADRLPAGGTDDGRVVWRYSAGRRWLELPQAALVRDGTDGFSGGGVIEIDLPADLAPGDDLRPAGLFWVSVAARGDLRRFGRVRAIHTNAVSATRRIAGSTGHGTPKLAPEQITRSQTALPGVAKIHQPGASFGGRAAEDTQAFRVRVSERLRHRARAIAPHDYAAMVLQAFPGISDAVCLSTARGTVDIVVTARRTVPNASLRPTVSFAERQRIAEWLSERTGAAVRDIRVRNPQFETIQVRAHVVAAPGVGPSVIDRLETALDRLIAPWLFDAAAPVPIGAGTLSPDVVAAKMERHDGVQRLAGLSLVQLYATPGADADALPDGLLHGLKDTARRCGDPTGLADPGPVLHPSTPWSVFVPAAQHRLSLLYPRAGLGALIVGADLGVTPPARRPVYRDDPSEIPMRPLPAGIGTLAVGRDLVVESAADACPPAGWPDGAQPAPRTS